MRAASNIVRMPTMPFKAAERGTIGVMDQSDRSVREQVVADIMTKEPVTLGPEDSLMEALEVMRRHRIRRLPVVVGDRLVGLLAEGDVKRAQPSILSSNQEEFDRVMQDTQVSRVMIREPVTVTADTSLLVAAQTLHRTKFGTLPVVDGEQLIGILTDADLLRVLIELLETEK